MEHPDLIKMEQAVQQKKDNFAQKVGKWNKNLTFLQR